MGSHVLSTYNQLPISFERGEGAWLWDTNGNKLLDLYAGIAVTGLGHNHPKVVRAIQEQVAKVMHVSNLVTIPQLERVSDLLAAASGMDIKTFMANSGAEANECIIKLARLYGHSKNIEVPKIIVMEGAFHGRTVAALSASASRKIQAGFEPLVPGFVRAKYNDPAALEAIAKQDPDIVAVLLEPIQGEGGVIVPDEGYLQAVRKICDKNEWLMLVDEIQAGMGRTGKMFCFQNAGIQPDAFSIAKGLGNGFPVGACAIKAPHYELFKPGSHGSTFGGNPVASAAAIATLEALINDKVLDNVLAKGEKLKSGLQKQLADHPNVVDIRGRGLMLAIELDRPARGALTHAIKHGLIFNTAGTHCLRLLPPLIITDDEVALALEKIPQVINDFVAEEQ